MTTTTTMTLAHGTMTIKENAEKNQHPDKTLVVLTGATATGKTTLAIQLAQHFATEILSADSRQFYRELKIGTAAPTQEELNQAVHHFVGHLSLRDYYNVSMFEHDALGLLEQLFETHDMVILCGGSGLYIDAVCKGIDLMPDIDPAVREMINKKYRSEGIEYLRDTLQKADPAYYDSVDKNNPNRMKRAVEVCISTGSSFTSFRKNNLTPRSFKTIKIALNLPREQLHEKIGRRVDLMIKSGLVQEATSLLPHRGQNALNTVGYKEIFDYLDGKMNLNQATEKIKTNTRRYARRQITWLKRYEDVNWFSPADPKKIIQFINTKIV